MRQKTRGLFKLNVTLKGDELMFLEERHEKILEMLSRDGKVLVKELAEKFSVTEDSIRKDLGTLESDGKLKRTYGGAVSIAEKLQMTEANRRRISDVESKRKIAAAAVKLMQPHDAIFLDISTISIAIAQILEKTAVNYKILTNMVDVLVMLARNPKINLFFAGGQINQNSLTSRDTAGGIHKARMIEVSKTSYIIAESRKMGTEGTYSFAKFSDVNGLITETELSENLTAAAEKLGVRIIVAE